MDHDELKSFVADAENRRYFMSSPLRILTMNIYNI